MTNESTPITDSPAAEQKAASVDKAQEAAVVMEQPGLAATIRGLGELLWGTVLAFFSDDCSSMAAALSFYSFFSLPALLTLVLTIVGRVADPVARCALPMMVVIWSAPLLPMRLPTSLTMARCTPTGSATRPTIVSTRVNSAGSEKKE